LDNLIMMMHALEEQHAELAKLFRNTFSVEPLCFEPIPVSGSLRKYYRLQNGNTSAVGTFSPDVDENRTFFKLTDCFTRQSLNVPQVLAISPCMRYYLQSDLGSTSLFDIITSPGKFPQHNLNNFLSIAVTSLVDFQVKGFNEISSSGQLQLPLFDRTSMMWDMYYFKYCFLKPSGVSFNEQLLESDFEWFAKELLEQKHFLFQYRDFQSRNIMVHNNQLYFIDYQGGRIGPPLYDIASFLYQARAKLDNDKRFELLSLYLDRLNCLLSIDKEELKAKFPAMAMFRIMQTLGAYGFRGFFEKKTHFIQSIPLAVDNFINLSRSAPGPHTAYITDLLEQYRVLFQPSSCLSPSGQELTVYITSFSFKNGYPEEHPEHGGGFVFDCRCLPNPGRMGRYKNLTGLDFEVIQFLDESDEAQRFIANATALVKDAVENYCQRRFSYLSVAFGCTGGQHRSVYCASKLALAIENTKNVRVVVQHREFPA